MPATIDADGRVVRKGSVVRVLSIKPSITARLPAEECRDVLSMKGDELEVYEVDEFGAAWVKKWWSMEDGKSYSHSLALNPKEMKLVK